MLYILVLDLIHEDLTWLFRHTDVVMRAAMMNNDDVLSRQNSW